MARIVMARFNGGREGRLIRNIADTGNSMHARESGHDARDDVEHRAGHCVVAGDGEDERVDVDVIAGHAVSQ